jgi:putative oxidoreductase
MKPLVLIGRVLYSAIFLMTVVSHFSGKVLAYAAMKGVPYPALLVPISGVVAILGALSIISGYKAKAGAWLIIIFLVPVSLYMHAFWKETDPTMMQMQMSNFLKNMSMLGAALMIAHFGSGPLSLDQLLKPKLKIKGFIPDDIKSSD